VRHAAGARGATVLLGNGDGSFRAAAHHAMATVPSSSALADVDLDAFPDLVVGHPSTNDLSVLLGSGDGSFLSAERFRAGSAPVGVDAVDLDGDGAPDLVTANRGDNGTPSLSVLLHR
jgi:hypothetical protein